MEITYSSLKSLEAEYIASVEEAKASMAEFHQGRSDAYEFLKSTSLPPTCSFNTLMITLRGRATHGLAHRDFCCCLTTN